VSELNEQFREAILDEMGVQGIDVQRIAIGLGYQSAFVYITLKTGRANRRDGSLRMNTSLATWSKFLDYLGLEVVIRPKAESEDGDDKDDDHDDKKNTDQTH
jgi:hypothetical protein